MLNVILANVAAQAMPMSQAMANTSNTMTNFVKWAGTIGAAIIAIILIYSITKDSFEYIKGSGSASIFKIITKVIFLMFMIGIIVVAQSYQSWMGQAADIANKGTNLVGDIVNELIP